MLFGDLRVHPPPLGLSVLLLFCAARRFEADEIYAVRKVVHPILQAEWDLRCAQAAHAFHVAALCLACLRRATFHDHDHPISTSLTLLPNTHAWPHVRTPYTPPGTWSTSARSLSRRQRS